MKPRARDFRPDWSALRRWRWIGAIALLAFVPAFAGAALSGSEALATTAFFGFPVILAISAWRLRSFRCPACAERFQPTVMGTGRNCVSCGLRCYAARLDERDPPEDPALAAIFQGRRQRWLKIALPFFGLGILGWIAAMALMLAKLDRHVVWGGALMAFGILGFVLSTMALLRCPRCGRLPAAGRGVSLDPVSCPHCGLRFK